MVISHGQISLTFLTSQGQSHDYTHVLHRYHVCDISRVCVQGTFVSVLFGMTTKHETQADPRSMRRAHLLRPIMFVDPSYDTLLREPSGLVECAK